MLKIWENTMLIVKNADEINSIEGIELRQLLTSRRKQLNSDLYLMEDYDTADDLERAIGFPVMTNIFDGLRYPHPDFVPLLGRMLASTRNFATSNLNSAGRFHLFMFARSLLSNPNALLILFPYKI
jgi:hypothetical protein